MNIFEASLQYTFQDPRVLEEAMTHPSALRHGKSHSYERLEFLGDRVLGLEIATLLYHESPDEAEGVLAKRFAGLVCRETLVSVAREVGIDKVVKYSNDKSANSTKQFETILADTCEALIAAIYLDGGIKAASHFIQTYWKKRLNIEMAPPLDAKTTLQEWAQSQKKKYPTYQVVNETGPAHAPHFIVSVQIEGLELLTGEGSSKRLAEQDAAEKMLIELRGKSE